MLSTEIRNDILKIWNAFLQNQKIRQVILKKASTTTISDLNHGDFYSLTLPVPTVQIQNKFSAIAQNIRKQKCTNNFAARTKRKSLSKFVAAGIKRRVSKKIIGYDFLEK